VVVATGLRYDNAVELEAFIVTPGFEAALVEELGAEWSASHERVPLARGGAGRRRAGRGAAG
jgi:hypothetical protein